MDPSEMILESVGTTFDVTLTAGSQGAFEGMTGVPYAIIVGGKSTSFNKIT